MQLREQRARQDFQGGLDGARGFESALRIAVWPWPSLTHVVGIRAARGIRCGGRADQERRSPQGK